MSHQQNVKLGAHVRIFVGVREASDASLVGVRNLDPYRTQEIGSKENHVATGIQSSGVRMSVALMMVL